MAILHLLALPYRHQLLTNVDIPFAKSHYGYKLSTSVDKRYKLVRKLKVSTAAEHDTHHLEDVLDNGNTSRDVYTDKGYVDGEREARLQDDGWRMHIQRKAAQRNRVVAFKAVAHK